MDIEKQIQWNRQLVIHTYIETETGTIKKTEVVTETESDQIELFFNSTPTSFKRHGHVYIKAEKDRSRQRKNQTETGTETETCMKKTVTATSTET